MDSNGGFPERKGGEFGRSPTMDVKSEQPLVYVGQDVYIKRLILFRHGLFIFSMLTLSIKKIK